jgi:ribonuclease HI
MPWACNGHTYLRYREAATAPPMGPNALAFQKVAANLESATGTAPFSASRPIFEVVFDAIFTFFSCGIHSVIVAKSNSKLTILPAMQVPYGPFTAPFAESYPPLPEPPEELYLELPLEEPNPPKQPSKTLSPKKQLPEKQSFRGSVWIKPSKDALEFACELSEYKQIPNTLVLWVDGSTSYTPKNGAAWSGSAVVYYDSTVEQWAEYGFTMSTGDNNSAELLAIAEGLKIAIGHVQGDCTKTDIVLFSDSQTSLGYIYELYKPPGKMEHEILLERIFMRSEELEELGVKLELHWVPGHKGILGFKRADMLSRRCQKVGGHELTPLKMITGQVLVGKIHTWRFSKAETVRILHEQLFQEPTGVKAAKPVRSVIFGDRKAFFEAKMAKAQVRAKERAGRRQRRKELNRIREKAAREELGEAAYQELTTRLKKQACSRNELSTAGDTQNLMLQPLQPSGPLSSTAKPRQ